MKTIKSKVARNAILGRAEFASSYVAAQKKIEKSIEKLMELGQ